MSTGADAVEQPKPDELPQDGASQEPNSATAWGSIVMPAGSCGRWRFGALSLWIERSATEWTVTSLHDPESLAERPSYEPRWHEAPPDNAESVRCAAGSTGEELVMSPLLANRPIVTKPERPFMLLPNDEAILFIGSPLWVRVAVLQTTGSPCTLLEQPTVRLSDTWFGPSTREGEMCYASTTRARMRMDVAEAPPRPARALTCVSLRNQASDTLMFERLKIPVAELGLFIDAEGQHWTHGLVVDRGRDGDDAECRVEAGPPAQAKDPRLVSEPRQANPGMFRRTLAALVG